MSSLIWIAATAAMLNGPADPAPQANKNLPLTKWAATDRTQVDDDFSFQGEYLGQVQAVDGTAVTFGLQVTALGAGQFSARGYQDGLPGNGWDQETAISWEGVRSDDILVFDGPRGRIIIQGGGGLIIDSSGTAVGQVGKIRRASTTLGATPPAGAQVLFDGTNVDSFEGGKITPEGLLDVGGLTKTLVNDFRLHLEFRLPYMPYARDQGRANSGVYIQRRYEVQILDSFGLEPVFNGCAALYRQQIPDLNMSFPPLQWQTYDIFFNAARWDEAGQKTADAQITVYHNGVAVHKDRVVPTKTGAGQKEAPTPGPILLQDHGNPIRYRNVWLQLDPPDENSQYELAGDTTTDRQLAAAGQATDPQQSSQQLPADVATSEDSDTVSVPYEAGPTWDTIKGYDSWSATGDQVPFFDDVPYQSRPWFDSHAGYDRVDYRSYNGSYNGSYTSNYAQQSCESCGSSNYGYSGYGGHGYGGHGYGGHGYDSNGYSRYGYPIRPDQIAPLYGPCVSCPGSAGSIIWRGRYPY